MGLILRLCLCLFAAPLAAQDCPPAPDHTAAYDDLYDALRESRDPATAQRIGGALWQLWLDAPDARAQALLDKGMAQREGFDLSGAVDTLDELVAYCPDYAEGYNQRAFASFLAQDYAAALTDLDRTLAILPRHTGALTGKALTLIGLGREAEAQEVLREALALNPWLAERALLDAPDGTDI